MGKVWILDTETKGTGANMVPLEKVLRRGDPDVDRVFDPPKPRVPAVEEPAPRAPREFKVVDVMTRQVLAEDADGRATVDLLKTLRSMVDVVLFVWEPEQAEWRMLSLDEQRAIWALRDRERAGH